MKAIDVDSTGALIATASADGRAAVGVPSLFLAVPPASLSFVPAVDSNRLLERSDEQRGNVIPKEPQSVASDSADIDARRADSPSPPPMDPSAPGQCSVCALIVTWQQSVAV